MRPGVTLRLGALVFIALSAAAAIAAFGSAEPSVQGPPYEVYRPAGLSRANPVPLVLGIGGSLTKTGSGLNGFADRYGFVVAYPDPGLISVPPDENASQAARATYISNVIDELKTTQNIDPSRVYVTGASRSGIESYRLACRIARKITAIGSVAGSLLPQDAATCHPARPLSVMEFHGTGDTAVPYNGNQLYPPVQQTIAFWRDAEGCPAKQTTSTKGPVTIDTWSPCKNGTAVRLVTYAGGGHGWPRNSQVDATAELWAFFSGRVSASGAAGSSLTATGLRVAVLGTGARRTLTIRVTVSRDATARAALQRGSRTVASKSFKIAAGTRSLRMRLAKSVRPGAYRLKLTLTASDGSRKVVAKTVRIRA